MPRPRLEPEVRHEIFNLPNVLTAFRILLIPLVLVLMAWSADGEPNARRYAMLAALVYSAAAITDFFDGWLARNFGMMSIIGKFMDPVADKLLVMATCVMLVELGRLPAWLVVILLAREISITALRMVAESEGLRVDVSQSGKWKTAFQMVGLLGLLIHFTYPVDYGFWQTPVDYHAVGLLCVGISLFFSIFSATSYFAKFIGAIGDKYRGEGDA
jgi:CDP-diacylglycerol--glycerol-3-phosphate 3-phosphatidyltransferase